MKFLAGNSRRPRRRRAAVDRELVTVVLCTHRRHDALRRCLESLRHLHDEHYEVIVIENTPQPELSAAEIQSLGARHVHEPLPGLDCARNRGIAEADGSIVAFIDDDCEADTEWL